MDLEKIYKLLLTNDRINVLIALEIVKSQNIPIEGELKKILWHNVGAGYIDEVLDHNSSTISYDYESNNWDYQKDWRLTWK